MWIDAVVMITAPDASRLEQRVLDAAMQRRGWEKAGDESFKASFTNVESDNRLVQMIEQDVREAVYVAGINSFDSVCLLSDPLASDEEFGDLEHQDSDLNLDAY